MKTTSKEIARTMEMMRAGKRIYENGLVTAIKMSNGKEVKISDDILEPIAKFEKVRFRTPQIEGKFLKFIEPGIGLERSGLIRIIKPYWRYGIIVGGKLVTRTFRVWEAPEKTKTEMPFGVEVIGNIIISKSTNTRTKEVRMIVDFYIIKENQPTEASYEVKIGGKKRENTVFSASIPGTEEFIVVNKIG